MRHAHADTLNSCVDALHVHATRIAAVYRGHRARVQVKVLRAEVAERRRVAEEKERERQRVEQEKAAAQRAADERRARYVCVCVCVCVRTHI